MRRLLCAVGLSFVSGTLLAGIFPDDIIMRGDANHNGAVQMADAVFIQQFLFYGGPAPPCMNEADAQHDGRVDQSDAIYILNWLYNGGPAPPAPGPYNTMCTTSSSPIVSCNAGC